MDKDKGLRRFRFLGPKMINDVINGKFNFKACLL
jgi:hypothetical protein